MKKIASYEYFIPQHSRCCTLDAVCKFKCFTDRIVHVPTNGVLIAPRSILEVNLAWRSQRICLGCLFQQIGAPSLVAIAKLIDRILKRRQN